MLVFPLINFTEEEQVAFTKTLGKFAPELRDGDGENIHKITLDTKQNATADYLKGSMYWHIDGTMNKVPILASLLSAHELSAEGGQTEFSNTYAAYDHLPATDKTEYEKLRVLHSAWNTLFYHDPEPSLSKLQEMMKIGDNELPLV